MNRATLVVPGSFESDKHFYAKALNAQIHPMPLFFMKMAPERIVNRYCHLHPMVDKQALWEVLTYRPKHFLWAGTDLIHVTSAGGKRQMVVIETNSCPSGQKSMPLVDEHKEQGGYRQLIEQCIKPRIEARRKLPAGGLAVIYDKNPMEASGYAAALADSFNEPVFLTTFYKDDPEPTVRFENGVMQVCADDGWRPIRAVFRYVTQTPWDRLPTQMRTLIVNPTVACLAGGRNKMMADKAYDFYNAELAESGLKILTPETIRDVRKAEVPLWVQRMGGQAVVKVPYSNAGQGVYTIVNSAELDAFMQQEFHYDKFIVQSLIGNYQWSSTTSAGKFYHVGTVPNLKARSYVSDIRMQVCATADGYRPLALYARRAGAPLVDELTDQDSSWDILGTNLSVKRKDGGWDSDVSRLLMVDRRDFNRLGIGLDDLLDGYIQSVLAAIAIDKMAINLVNQRGGLRRKQFAALNDDPALLNEILRAPAKSTSFDRSLAEFAH